MPFSVGLTITGLQKMQRRNLRRMAILEPQEAPGRAVQWATGEMHRHLTLNSPWETGALKASRRISLNLSIPRGMVFNSANSYNPRSDTPPHVYDAFLHARGQVRGLRGGILASYPFTMEKNGPGVLRQAVVQLQSEVKGI